jgi:histidinol phosphatase-like PHP family hydrolase
MVHILEHPGDISPHSLSRIPIKWTHGSNKCGHFSATNPATKKSFDYLVVSCYNHHKKLGYLMNSQYTLIDLHMHTFLSDGELGPSELVQRSIAAGYRAMAITDHADSSNLEFLVAAACSAAADFNSWTDSPICIVPGIEITHVIPAMIAELAERARSLGARIVVVHGETTVEPVPSGTNRAAIEAGVDILAHPGLITKEDVECARDHGVALEITARKGHSLANGHVAGLARGAGATMVLNSDAHSPSDLLDPALRERVILGAGLDKKFVEEMAHNSSQLVRKLMGKEVG